MAELRVVRCSSWDEHPGLLGAWDTLVAESAADSVFLTREWLMSWWVAYGGKRQLTLLLCFDGAELVGLVPLYRAGVRTDLRVSLDVLRFVGDGTYDSDHLDLVARAGYEVDVVRAMVDWLVAQRAEWDLFDVDNIRADSPSLQALLGEIRARGWSHTVVDEQHAVIDLPDTWDGYLASLSSSMRSGIRRKERDAQKGKTITFRRCEREADLPAFLQQLYAMHGDRWENRGQPGSFAFPGRQAFYERLGRELLARGWLSFWLLDVDGDPAAAEFGFRYGSTHSFLQSGFSSTHAHESVGILLKSHILQGLITDGIRHYDFLGGGEAYKLKWGPRLAHHLNLRCARERSVGAAVIEARKVVDTTKAWLHRTIPPSLAMPLRRGYRRLRPYRDELLDDQEGSQR